MAASWSSTALGITALFCQRVHVGAWPLVQWARPDPHRATKGNSGADAELSYHMGRLGKGE
jgi:hypothetical protein